MHRPSRVSWSIAAVFIVGALVLLLPTETFNTTDPRIRAAAVLALIGFGVVVAGSFGKVTVSAGRVADAEVIDLTEETRRWKGRMITVWVARVRYRDAAGVIHEGIIDDCNEDDCARLRPGTTTRIQHDERNPKSFVWIPEDVTPRASRRQG